MDYSEIFIFCNNKQKNLSEEFFNTFYRQSCIWRFYVHSQKSQISSFAVTSFLITSAVTLISLLSDIVFQLTRFNDPRSPSSLFSSSYPFPSFFHNQSAALVPKCRKKAKHRSVIRYITLSGSQVLSGVIDV